MLKILVIKLWFNFCFKRVYFSKVIFWLVRFAEEGLGVGQN